jgi:hypothetical protein
MVYSYSPFVVLRVTDDWKIETWKLEKTRLDFGTFRGGAGPVRVPGGYYLVVHEVLPHRTGRNYIHRILFLDDALDITYVSPPFKMVDQPIEYVSGLAVLGDTVYLTWGERDNKAYLTQLPLADFDAYCKRDGPVTDYGKTNLK